MNTFFPQGCSREIVDVGTSLKLQPNWIPAYCLARPELELAVAESFPGGIRHDVTAANCGAPEDRRLAFRSQARLHESGPAKSCQGRVSVTEWN